MDLRRMIRQITDTRMISLCRMNRWSWENDIGSVDLGMANDQIKDKEVASTGLRRMSCQIRNKVVFRVDLRMMVSMDLGKMNRQI